VEIVAVLVLFPLIAAGLLLVVTNDRARGIIVAVSAAVIAIGSIVLAALHLAVSPSTPASTVKQSP